MARELGASSVTTSLPLSLAAYRERILAAVPEGITFTPLMTAYLTDATDGNELARGHAEGVFTAAKLYPAHATTGSAHGVTNVTNIMPALEHMARIGMPLLIHGEVTDAHVDIFDREAVFIEQTLSKLVRDLRAAATQRTMRSMTLWAPEMSKPAVST